jgi:phospholipid-binding lipoprotein MlaA
VSSVLLLLGSALAASAVAAAPEPSASASKPAERPKDPFERVNRKTYHFNDQLDRHLLRPLAEGYRDHVPDVIRAGVSHFIANIEYPTVIANDLLQLKLKAAGQDVARFAVNTVVGIGGLGDPASSLGLPVHNEDFGQTLGYWGVPPGPYLVLPFLGASDLRDAPGWFVDSRTTGGHYVFKGPARWGEGGLSVFDIRVQALAADQTIDSAFDPYALVRDAYLARRNYLVHDGNVPSDDSSYELTDDEVTTE